MGKMWRAIWGVQRNNLFGRYLLKIFFPYWNNIRNFAWKIWSCHQCCFRNTVAVQPMTKLSTYIVQIKFLLDREMCLAEVYLSTNNWRHSSNLPSINKQRKATLFFPSSLAMHASFVIPSASPSDEYRSNNPLRSVAWSRHSSAISSCSYCICNVKVV